MRNAGCGLYYPYSIILYFYKKIARMDVPAARDYILKLFNYSSGQITAICDLILLTRMPQMASSALGNILCDADLVYLGRDDFFINSFHLKLEWQLFGVKTHSTPEN